jgi:hypothetical protein
MAAVQTTAGEHLASPEHVWDTASHKAISRQPATEGKWYHSGLGNSKEDYVHQAGRWSMHCISVSATDTDAVSVVGLQPKSFLLTDLGITQILHPHTKHKRIKSGTIFYRSYFYFFH